METPLPRLIVVGVNGSAASLAALRWAAGEASLRRASLLVVHVWDRTQRQVAPYATLVGRLTPGEERSAARARLTAVVRTAFGPVPPTGVTAELAEGLVARALLDRAAGADLLVLGATAPTVAQVAAGHAGPTAGPVARACLSRARCPVVIVSAPATMGAAGPGAETRGAVGAAARRSHDTSHDTAATAAARPLGHRGHR